jgi:hypothetical protein
VCYTGILNGASGKQLAVHRTFDPPRTGNEDGMARSRKWSSTFLELLGNESKTLDIQQYDLCLTEWKAAHESKTLKNYALAILLFRAGLWAVWENSLFMAVLLLALAANFNRQSSHHVLIAEIMGSQRLLV